MALYTDNPDQYAKAWFYITLGIVVAPQLTVVPAPPLNKAFERMRGTPTLFGW